VTFVPVECSGSVLNGNRYTGASETIALEAGSFLAETAIPYDIHDRGNSRLPYEEVLLWVKF
jgi:hypothetical protein